MNSFRCNTRILGLEMRAVTEQGLRDYQRPMLVKAVAKWELLTGKWALRFTTLT